MSKVTVVIDEKARDKAKRIVSLVNLKENREITIGEATEEAIEAYLKKLEGEAKKNEVL
jgi:low affinity Fe/Cu permease